MDTIISNLADPSWWFTGLFFAGLIWAIRRIRTLGVYSIRRFLKSRRLLRLRRIRSVRTSQAAVMYEIVRSQAYFLVFVLTCVVYLLWYTVTPLSGLFREQPLVALVFACPIYIFELAWLFRESFTRDVIAAHNKTLKYARKLHRPDTRPRAA